MQAEMHKMHDNVKSSKVTNFC